jgi:hypothetical protein
VHVVALHSLRILQVAWSLLNLLERVQHSNISFPWSAVSSRRASWKSSRCPSLHRSVGAGQAGNSFSASQHRCVRSWRRQVFGASLLPNTIYFRPHSFALRCSPYRRWRVSRRIITESPRCSYLMMAGLHQPIHFVFRSRLIPKSFCSLVFTASLKGTIIRVFSVSDGSRLYKASFGICVQNYIDISQLRRGATPTDIRGISINAATSLLCIWSSKGTIIERFRLWFWNSIM